MLLRLISALFVSLLILTAVKEQNLLIKKIAIKEREHILKTIERENGDVKSVLE